MAMADVTIRGAGISGLSVAWACQSRGARVRVIDPFGVGAGASGGVVGALAPHVPENWNPKKAFQLESLLMAEGFWRDVEEVGGRSPGYARLGRIQPLADDRALELAQERSTNAPELWQGKAEWRVVKARELDGLLPNSPTDLFVFDTLSARVSPGEGCAALAAAIVARGGEVVTDGAEEGAVVHATGWRGLEALNDAFGRSVGTGVKGQAALLKYDARNAPQVFAEALHIIPHANGTVAIGSTSEREFEEPDQPDEQALALVDHARALVPALGDAPVLRTWAGVRPRAKSRAPLCGAWPGRKGHFIANGGSKIGFGMAPKLAELMADLVLEGRNGLPPDFDAFVQLAG